MNVLVYVSQRLAVAAGLPSDGIDPAGRRATFILASVQMLVLHACGTAIFAHVLAHARRRLEEGAAMCASRGGRALEVALEIAFRLVRLTREVSGAPEP